MTVRALILAASGVNCDRETAQAVRMAGADAELVHLNQLLDGERRLVDFGLLVLPGGFSYGDHLGAGAVLSTTLRYRLLDQLQAFVDDGRPVLGICNGFQVLARLGFLGAVSLVPNVPDRFICRWVPLAADPSSCLFLRGIDRLELPVAHGQGRVIVGDPRKSPPAALRYGENPNGSERDIAGVCNERGNVLGLMPHPERYVTPYHHPRWQRRQASRSTGLTIFCNAVRYVQEEL